MGIKNIGLSVVYDNDLDLEFRQNKLIFESSTVNWISFLKADESRKVSTGACCAGPEDSLPFISRDDMPGE